MDRADYRDPALSRSGVRAGKDDLFNATVIAGADPRISRAPAGSALDPETTPLPISFAGKSSDMAGSVRPGTDDRSDIDYADTAVHERMRHRVMRELGAAVLGE